MKQFDDLIKEMAEKEEMIVPEGFDARVRAALEELPPRIKKCGLGAVKAALIAAAVCAALVCTAFAASPGLREMLMDAMGGFAPYAHRQKDETYVIDGIEFKVVSALADDFTVRVYVEARDLEGDRLDKLGSVFGVLDIPNADHSSISMSVFSAKCVSYDEGTKTALLVFTNWGQFMADDLSGSTVKLFNLTRFSDNAYQQVWENSEGTAFPVEIKPIPSLVADAELASALRAEEVRLSNLSLSVIFKGDGTWEQFAGADVSAKLADGTLVEAPWEGGQGSFGGYGTESARKVLVWNFREPLEPEQVDGIYVGGDYFPIRELISPQ